MRRPCVAISHFPSSGGHAVGRRVADLLGYGFFDREIIDQIVRDEGVQQRLVRELDEHVRSAIDRYLLDAFRGGNFTESDYLKSVIRVLQALGHEGAAVVLGRGAPFVLSGRQALRVLVVAPTPQRIDRLAQKLSLDLVPAAKRLEQDESNRREFLRHHFGIDRQDDPMLYDLVVNTGGLSVDVAADLVADAVRRRFPQERSAEAFATHP
ncbi:MAG TPA: cytidylate kinase-like family protein [Myxococcota bacterium]|nr:cytidylate kinase-like family protein [Myxococcota bacterium]